MSDDSILLPNQNSGANQNSGSQPDSKIHPKERILTAALSLFVEQGYFNTNVPDISKLSSCSVGSIYHHFVNKEEIASSLYLDGIQQFRSALTNAISDQNDFETIIRNIVKTLLGFAEEHEQLSRYLWLSRHDEFLTGNIKHPTKVGFDPLGRKLTRAILTAKKSGVIPNIKADVFWSIVFGVPVSYVRDWLDNYTSSSPKSAADLLANAVVAALHGAKL